jgi:hypothetical protein
VAGAVICDWIALATIAGQGSIQIAFLVGIALKLARWETEGKVGE